MVVSFETYVASMMSLMMPLLALPPLVALSEGMAAWQEERINYALFFGTLILTPLFPILLFFYMTAPGDRIDLGSAVLSTGFIAIFMNTFPLCLVDSIRFARERYEQQKYVLATLRLMSCGLFVWFFGSFTWRLFPHSLIGL